MERRRYLPSYARVSWHPQHVIDKQSQDTASLLLGFAMPAEGHEAKFYNQLKPLSEQNPRALLVGSTGNMTLES